MPRKAKLGRIETIGNEIIQSWKFETAVQSWKSIDMPFDVIGGDFRRRVDVSSVQYHHLVVVIFHI